MNESLNNPHVSPFEYTVNTWQSLKVAKPAIASKTQLAFQRFEEIFSKYKQLRSRRWKLIIQ